MGDGHSLLDDPMFLALARQYRSTVTAPLRAQLADVLEGHWYALVLVRGRERRAIDRVADDVRLPTYLPMVREVRSNWRGARFPVRRALFVGYGFVLAADIDALFGRITSCEGVLGIMCEDGLPAAIRSGFDDCRKGHLGAMRFDHNLIEFIRQVENGADGILAAELQAQQDRLTAQWREQQVREPKRNRRKTPHARRPPVIEIDGVDSSA